MITGNERAMPVAASYSDTDTSCLIPVDGLTIRQHFAAMAMQGLLSSPNYDINEEGAFDYVSQDATRIADALINELNKNQTT